MRRSKVECPIVVDHRSIDLARRKIEAMSTADLCDWATNVAYDVAQLVDQYRAGENDHAVGDLGLATAMLHACVAEITTRPTRGRP